MATIEELKTQISSAQDLQSVVKTMKALAAVSIRQYEKAVESLVEYNRTVEMGFQILLKQRHFAESFTIPRSLLNLSEAQSPSQSMIAIIFGSDQGLCGQFNQQIAHHAIEHLNQQDVSPDQLAIAGVGARVIPSLETAGYGVTEAFPVPRSASDITPQVQEIVLTIEQWREERQCDRILLFYNHPLSGASYESRHLQLLPLDPEWLRQLEAREWATSMVPSYTMNWQQLFSALIRQYLFVSLYQAFAASLASENASRLSSMQSAQKNIDERLSDLNSQYRRQRQSSITAELLDVVAGFEALT